MAVLEEPERRGRGEPGGGVGRQRLVLRGGGDGGEEHGRGERVEGPGVVAAAAVPVGGGRGGVEVHGMGVSDLAAAAVGWCWRSWC